MNKENELDKIFKKLENELSKEEEEVRRKKIEEIKRLIAEGKYNVPVEELVESILRKLKKGP
ncbi:MAG: flagellar biosynthesis anti-sigma factor FlgM [Sulfurihydrogenibium sp.]|uniref:flagellar biosynthesis anti-sigma factor FlgM n=1 Tax=Sulfurihydrogenibium sp. TaxID=2053621 RepID=UPI003C7D7B71